MKKVLSTTISNTYYHPSSLLSCHCFHPYSSPLITVYHTHIHTHAHTRTHPVSHPNLLLIFPLPSSHQVDMRTMTSWMYYKTCIWKPKRSSNASWHGEANECKPCNRTGKWPWVLHRYRLLPGVHWRQIYGSFVYGFNCTFPVVFLAPPFTFPFTLPSHLTLSFTSPPHSFTSGILGVPKLPIWWYTIWVRTFSIYWSACRAKESGSDWDQHWGWEWVIWVTWMHPPSIPCTQVTRPPFGHPVILPLILTTYSTPCRYITSHSHSDIWHFPHLHQSPM